MKKGLEKVLALLTAVVTVCSTLTVTSVAQDRGTLGNGNYEQTLSQSMAVGDTVKIAGYSERDEWHTDVEGIVTYPTSGEDRTVTAVKVGKAVITRDFYWFLGSFRRQSTYEINVTSAVSLASQTMTVGDSLLPEAAMNSTTASVTGYTSSDSSIIAVSDDGKTLTAVAPGIATITANAVNNGYSSSASASFTVVPKLSLTLSQMAVYEGSTEKISFTVSPENCRLSFSSSNPAVAAVDASGVVTGVSKGEAMITVTATANGQSSTATVKAVVGTNVKSVEGEDTSLLIGHNTQVLVSWTPHVPEGKSNYEMTYAITAGSDLISAEVVAREGMTLTLKLQAGAKTGEAELTFSVDGMARKLKVTVSGTSFKLNYDALQLVLGGERRYLEAYSTNDNAFAAGKYEIIAWNIADPTVIEVDSEGFVKALSNGETLLSATVRYYPTGEKTDYFDSETPAIPVTVGSNVAGVEYMTPVSGTEINVVLREGVTVDIGSKQSFRAIIRKVDDTVTTVNRVSFVSSDPAIISAQGSEASYEAVVKALKQGTADLTVSSEGKSAVAHITVLTNIESVNFPKTLTLYKGAPSSKLGQSLLNYYDENGRRSSLDEENGYSVTFRTSDSTVVKINDKGEATPVAAGTARLTAIVEGAEYSCDVTVKDSFDSFTLEPSAKTIDLNDVVKTWDLKEAILITYVPNEGANAGQKVTCSLADYPGMIEFSFTSLNGTVASVNSEGVVTALSKGYATITVCADGQNINALLTVTENGEVAEESGSYKLVIHYVYGDDCQEMAGQLVADDWVGNYSAGEKVQISVDCPVKPGYRADTLTYTETLPRMTANVERTVFYHVAPVTFKVAYYAENADGSFTQFFSKTLSGINGDPVKLYAKDIETLSAEQTEALQQYIRQPYVRDMLLSADSKTVVEIHYLRRSYAVRFDLDGGIGTNPVYGRFGTPLSLSKPTKSGYDFVGWFDKDGKETTLPTEIPTENVTYYARWSIGNAKYHVYHWKQNANDNQYTLADIGGVAAIEELTGATGKTTAATAKTFEHFHLAGDIVQKVISADGSTIVNIYYDRDILHAYFYNSRGTELLHTITGRYGQTVADQWPSGSWYVAPNSTTFQTNINVLDKEYRFYGSN